MDNNNFHNAARTDINIMVTTCVPMCVFHKTANFDAYATLPFWALSWIIDLVASREPAVGLAPAANRTATSLWWKDFAAKYVAVKPLGSYDGVNGLA